MYEHCIYLDDEELIQKDIQIIRKLEEFLNNRLFNGYYSYYDDLEEAIAKYYRETYDETKDDFYKYEIEYPDDDDLENFLSTTQRQYVLQKFSLFFYNFYDSMHEIIFAKGTNLRYENLKQFHEEYTNKYRIYIENILPKELHGLIDNVFLNYLKEKNINTTNILKYSRLYVLKEKEKFVKFNDNPKLNEYYYQKYIII